MRDWSWSLFWGQRERLSLFLLLSHSTAENNYMIIWFIIIYYYTCRNSWSIKKTNKHICHILCMIPQIIFMYWWTDWAPLCLSLLQDSHCPRELPCFWFSPPGCLWLAHSISHLFSPLFWAISAWSACQHILSTLRCSSPTWNEGVQLKAWRKRLDRTRYLWNSTHWGFLFFFLCWPEAHTGSGSQFSPTVFPCCLHLLRHFKETGPEMHFRRSFSVQKFNKAAVIFVHYFWPTVWCDLGVACEFNRSPKIDDIIYSSLLLMRKGMQFEPRS